MTVEAGDPVIGIRIKHSSILYVVKWFRLVTASVQRVNEQRLVEATQAVYKETKRGTMKATGQLESLLVRRRVKTTHGARFTVGYSEGGSNKQAEKQEFDDGKVHRRVNQHQYKLAGFGRAGERAKCSRMPEDLWAFSGGYAANPKARRRALALAIEHRYKTTVRFATNLGDRYVYAPSGRNMAAELSMLTQQYLKAVQR